MKALIFSAAYQFGIACYFVRDVQFDEEGNETEFDKVETISIAVKDYWK
jgi:hypothetical protein